MSDQRLYWIGRDAQARYRQLRAWCDRTKPPLPPDFWDKDPSTKEEGKVKVQIVHTLLALMDGEAPDTCTCDDCQWTREQLAAGDGVFRDFFVPRYLGSLIPTLLASQPLDPNRWGEPLPLPVRPEVWTIRYEVDAS